MKKKIKKWGDSAIITLDKENLEFNDLMIGDWVDIEIVKSIPPKEEDNELNGGSTK